MLFNRLFVYLQHKYRKGMKYIALPDGRVRRLSFYLAMEEYVARNIGERDCFFMWQVEPSVIFGRNQLIENEVNMDFCRAHGIMTYRRKSGGGCVYADMNNVMFSYITADEGVGFTFHRYINMVVHVLRKMGVDAKASGRNDVMIGDRKVSGNAFYRIPGRSIVHGTMLYDTDMVNMVGAITPTDEKLLCKGIASVRQRIALLKDHTTLTLDEFKDFVRRNLCQGEIMLNDSDVKAIDEIEREYLSDEFIYGNNPKYTVVRKRRIEGVGDFELRIELKNGVIKNMTMLGDYFIAGDVDTEIIKPLKGAALCREELERILPDDDMEKVILGLKRDDFIAMMLDEEQ